MASESSYQVIARRYRPQSFDEVVGQEHVATTLKNAIVEKRVAHAYVFTGSRGVGKTSMARILAKALNCEQGPTAEPCGECTACREITDGTSPDVVEIDAASNTGVDDVRVLRDSIQYLPLRCRRKIYIVDEAHMLSRAAWNAFLKTLEEPPPHAAFIFATTESARLPETIRSRCQCFDFKRITTDDIVKRLAQVCGREKVKAETEVLRAVARAGRGSMRDAQSLLDQAIASAGSDTLTRRDLERVVGALPGERIADLLDAVGRQDLKFLFETIDALIAAGDDHALFLDQMAEHCRQLLVAHACGVASPLVDVAEELQARLAAQVKVFPVDRLLAFVQVLGDARRRLRDAANPRLVLEISLVKLARLGDLQTVADLVDRLARAEVAAPTAAPHAPGAAAPFVAPAAPRPAAAAPPSPSVPAAPPQAPPLFRDRPAAPAPAIEKKTLPASAAAAVGATPAPAPAPAAAAADPGRAVGLDDVRREWGRILERVGAGSTTLRALLREAEPREVAGAHLTVAFAKEHRFHLSQVDDAPRRAAIEDAVAAILGRRLALRLVLADGPVTPPAGAARDPEEGPPPGELRDAEPPVAAAEGGPPFEPATRGAVPPRPVPTRTADPPAAPRGRPVRLDEVQQNPIVRRALDLFDARILNVEE